MLADWVIKVNCKDKDKAEWGLSLCPLSLRRPERLIDRHSLPAGRMNWRGASGEPRQPPHRPVTVAPAVVFPPVSRLPQPLFCPSRHKGHSFQPFRRASPLCSLGRPQHTTNGPLGEHRSKVQIYTSFRLPGGWGCVCVSLCVCLCVGERRLLSWFPVKASEEAQMEIGLLRLFEDQCVSEL